ncbi:MAG: hypothetical protein R3C56_08810 [Pirellulaceae bacterium]
MMVTAGGNRDVSAGRKGADQGYGVAAGVGEVTSWMLVWRMWI